jgi:O-antigen/teichoic acid export membrane protein
VLGAQRDRLQLAKLFALSVKYLFLTLAIPTLLLIGFARELLSVWLGQGFATQSTTALQILAFGVLINSLAHVPFSYLQGLGRPDLTAKFHIIELPVYGLLAWLLVRSFGVPGAAMAWTLRVCMDAALLFWATSRKAAMGKRSGLARRSARTLAGLGAVYVIAIGLVLALQPPLEIRLASGAIVVAMFAFLAWHEVLDDEERAAFRSLLGSFRLAVRKSERTGGRPQFFLQKDVPRSTGRRALNWTERTGSNGCESGKSL